MMKSLRRLAHAAACALPLAGGPMLIGSTTAAIGQNLIDRIVADLGEGLGKARLASVPSSGAYTDLTIKFAAFKPGHSVDTDLVAKVEATTIRLTTAMQKRFSEHFRFVSDASQEALIASISAEIDDEEERARAIADIAAHGKPDILIRSLVYEISGETHLAYQAISVGTAEILAISRPTPLKGDAAFLMIADEASFRHDDPPSTSDGVYRPIALETERLLVAHGYDPGRVDGYLDDDLRKALRQYQADSALVVNGRMTWETVENLRRDKRGPR